MLYEVLEVRPGRRKKKSSFNPNREYLEKAMKEFVKKGGKITKIDPFPDAYWAMCYQLDEDASLVNLI